MCPSPPQERRINHAHGQRHHFPKVGKLDRKVCYREPNQEKQNATATSRQVSSLNSTHAPRHSRCPASRLPQPLASHHDPCAPSLALLISTWPGARSKVTKCPIRRPSTVTTVHDARRHKRARRILPSSLSYPGQS